MKNLIVALVAVLLVCSVFGVAMIQATAAPTVAVEEQPVEEIDIADNGSADNTPNNEITVFEDGLQLQISCSETYSFPAE